MRAVIVQHLLRLAPRERLFLAAGGLALLHFFLLMASPSQGAGESVELAQPATTPPPAYFPPPEPVVARAAPATATAAASASGLTLRSVLATGAIFAIQGGGERLVPIGREFLPGLTLKAVGLNDATVASSGADVRFELGRAGGAAAAVLGGSAAASPASLAASSDKAEQRDTMAYRLGLQPMKAKGGGYAIRPEADLPALRQAGLQPGDVIVGINGGGFDEERLMELSWSIANSSRTEFEFIRDGRRMKGAIGSRR
jgi:general secretion pathway protein C